MNLILIIIIITIFNFIIFKLNNFISRKLNLHDIPDFKRKIHFEKVALTGGIYIYINILLISIFLYLNSTNEIKIIYNNNREFFSFIFLITFGFLIGLYDDKYDTRPFTKLSLLAFVIFISALINEKIIIQILNFDTLNYTFQLSKLSIPFTIVSILLFVNALNMFDGIDLQVSFYSLFVIILISLKFNLIGLILFLPVIIFNIFFNYNKKIFLGDSGTNVLSVFIAFFIITIYNSQNLFFCEEIFLIMLVPGIDMFRLFLIRIVDGKNPFLPDKNHLHHLYLNKFTLKTSFILIQLQIIIPIFLYLLFDINILLLILLSLIFYIFVVSYLKFKRT